MLERKTRFELATPSLVRSSRLCKLLPFFRLLTLRCRPLAIRGIVATTSQEDDVSGRLGQGLYGIRPGFMVEGCLRQRAARGWITLQPEHAYKLDRLSARDEQA